MILRRSSFKQQKASLLGLIECAQLKLVRQPRNEPSRLIHAHMMNLIQMTQSLPNPLQTILSPVRLAQHHILIQCQLATLKIALKFDTILFQSGHVIIQHTRSPLAIPIDMHTQRVRQPMHFRIGPQRENPQSRIAKAVEVAHLYLKQAHVAEDLEVFGVDAEGLFVGFDGFGVVLGGAVEEAVDVPADVGSHIHHEPLLDQLNRLLLLVALLLLLLTALSCRSTIRHGIHNQSLHTKRLPMVRKPFEYGVRIF
mmetsp:Transcript_16293/g.29557  ORF Transcript_16293/g.29557 Transcript_16293/m.29557 type:complete len:254 (+) Transcript_16293:2087-2848(+)